MTQAMFAIQRGRSAIRALADYRESLRTLQIVPELASDIRTANQRLKMQVDELATFQVPLDPVQALEAERAMLRVMRAQIGERIGAINEELDRMAVSRATAEADGQGQPNL